ncbi:MAG: hypothetical protein J7L54_06475 [Elusimicrobia bacterium]|nr:hypothetical protein [Elusimicrobiota bacterium]
MCRKILIFALFFSAEVFAYTNLGILNFGDPVSAVSGKSTALGFTVFSSNKDASCVFTAPSTMNFIKRTHIFLALPAVYSSERIIPDDDWSGEEGGAYYNSKFYFDTPACAVIFPFNERLKFGFGYIKRQSFDYIHEKTTYSGGSPTGKIYYKGSGDIRGFDLDGSFYLGNNWTFGMAYEILKGDPTVERLDSTGNKVRNSFSYSGARSFFSLYKDAGMWNFTVAVFPSSNLDMSSTTVSGTSSVKETGEEKFPKTIAFGFNYIWAGAVSATLYFDIAKTYWSDVKATYRDSLSCRLGIENDLTARLQLRYGLALIPSYERSSVERAFVTAGISWYLTASASLDIGFAYGKRNYINNWQGAGVTYSGRVDETMKLINVSLDWKL